MPINYDIEYPKLQRKLARLTSRGFEDLHHENETLKARLDKIEPYLRHKGNCISGKRKWNNGKYDILGCDCGLASILGEAG